MQTDELKKLMKKAKELAQMADAYVEKGEEIFKRGEKLYTTHGKPLAKILMAIGEIIEANAKQKKK